MPFSHPARVDITTAAGREWAARLEPIANRTAAFAHIDDDGAPAGGRSQRKAVAAVVNIDSMDRLQRLDELEDDLRLLSIALVRAAADSGRRYDLDDVLAEAGIDPNSLDEE